jgi:hypothetical protein
MKQPMAYMMVGDHFPPGNSPLFTQAVVKTANFGKNGACIEVFW